jgi:hypothetical protein
MELKIRNKLTGCLGFMNISGEGISIEQVSSVKIPRIVDSERLEPSPSFLDREGITLIREFLSKFELDEKKYLCLETTSIGHHAQVLEDTFLGIVENAEENDNFIISEVPTSTKKNRTYWIYVLKKEFLIITSYQDIDTEDDKNNIRIFINPEIFDLWINGELIE